MLFALRFNELWGGCVRGEAVIATQLTLDLLTLLSSMSIIVHERTCRYSSSRSLLISSATWKVACLIHFICARLSNYYAEPFGNPKSWIMPR